MSMRSSTLAACVMLCGETGLTTSAQDWPKWGGTPGRNMASVMRLR